MLAHTRGRQSIAGARNGRGRGRPGRGRVCKAKDGGQRCGHWHGMGHERRGMTGKKHAHAQQAAQKPPPSRLGWQHMWLALEPASRGCAGEPDYSVLNGPARVHNWATSSHLSPPRAGRGTTGVGRCLLGACCACLKRAAAGASRLVRDWSDAPPRRQRGG